MKGKFDSLRDEVVYRQAYEWPDEVCGTDEDGCTHLLLQSFYGWDYLVSETSDGHVSVARFPMSGWGAYEAYDECASDHLHPGDRILYEKLWADLLDENDAY